jgi:ABC-2 type transport system permease protein
MIVTISRVTLQSLLARRRALLMLLLAGIPVLIGLLARLRGPSGDAVGRTAGALEPLMVATLLPLIALVFGTAALGAELEDGSAIHLLTKPIARWRIVTGKILAAVPVVAVLVGGSTLLTGLLIGGERGAMGVTLAFVAGVVVGSLLYVTLFVALSILSGRALIIGLIYVAIWEGMLAGLFDGTRVFSIRQYVVSLIAWLDPSDAVRSASTLDTTTAIVGAVVVFVLAFLVAVRALQRYQLSAGD